MQKKIIYLSMEVKIREYHAKLLFALYALSRGYQVVFGSKYPMNRYISSAPKGIYVGTGVTKALGGDPLRAKEHGHRAVSFDEEGLAYINLEQFIDKRINEDIIGRIDHFFTWGEFHNGLVKEKAPGLTNITAVGNMRFELLKEKYHSIYDDTVRKIKERCGSFILINTNLKVFNHVTGQEQLFKSLRHTTMIGSDEDEAFYKDRYDHQREIFESYQTLVASLSPKLREKGVNIVIRPHSSENKKTWEALKLPDVFVENSGNVVPWILASRGVIQKNCTTATETVYLGRPVITYSVRHDPRFDNEVSNGVGKMCRNPGEVWDVLEDWITEGREDAIDKQLKADREFLSRYVSNMGTAPQGDAGQNTAAAILDVLDKIETPELDDTGALFGIKRSFTDYVKIIKEKISAVSGRNKPKRKLRRQKFPGLKPRELRRDIERFSRTIDMPAENIVAKKIDEDLYQLTMSNREQAR